MNVWFVPIFKKFFCVSHQPERKEKICSKEGAQTFAVNFSLLVYLYIEMKLFCRQGTMKTPGKFLLLNMAGIFIRMLLIAVFFLFSIFQR
jgi:hypothetical protein